ncbi:MAG: hypothetical protein NVS1B11_01880 [Terriglobales bacterium]
MSYQDIPHTFVLSYVYELPIGPGKRFLSHGVASKVLGGWQVGGVQRYQSGQPLAYACATGVPGYDGCIRYDRVPGQPLRTNSTFNLASSITNGNSGCTPDQRAQDFSLEEAIVISIVRHSLIPTSRFRAVQEFLMCSEIFRA